MTFKKPLIAIVCITYNHEEFIKDALEGFVMQKTDFPFIVIVADDCSTDSTPEIIKEYAQKYPDIIKLILRDKNLGSLENFRQTLSMVENEFVALCEGDDYWINENKLQMQTDFLKKNKNYSAVFCPAFVKTEYGEITKSDIAFPELIGKEFITLDDLLYGHNYIHTSSILYRWRFTDEDILANFPSDIMPGDWYLHLLHAQKGNFAIINKRMSVYRRHKNGIWYLSLTSWDEIFCKYGIQLLNFYFYVYKNITDSSKKYLLNIFIPKLSCILKILNKEEKFENSAYIYEKFSNYMPLRDELEKQELIISKQKCNKYKKLFNIFLRISIVLLMFCIFLFMDSNKV